MNAFCIKLENSLRNRKRGIGEPESPAGSYALGSGDFVYTFELVPARASRGKALDEILRFAKEASQGSLVTALSITDNAGGHPALMPISLGQEIKALGIEPVIHFSCKDRNRNTIESHLLELDRSGLKSLLVLTGDYPRYGFMGNAKPVFDLDSVHVLGMVTNMNKGFVLDPRAPGGGVSLDPMDFYAGCVVSPFKRLEAELVPQYLKLKRKVGAGARFVVSQMGYDARKYHELRLFMDQEGLNVPLLGTVFIPTLRLARVLRKGVVPGCVFPGRLLERFEKEAAGSDDEGLSFRLEIGARLMAILKGIGYEGAHISGPGLNYSHVEKVIRRSLEIGNGWMEYVDDFLFPEEWDFWLFTKDVKSGLNLGERSPKSRISLGVGTLLHYFFSSLVHELCFSPGKSLYDICASLSKRISGSGLESFFTRFEYVMKEIFYDCRHCGDCTIGNFGFICPQSQCAKFLLNGPCGGSRDGWCEVWPGKKRCFYVRAYERLVATGHDLEKDDSVLPPRNWVLYETASWLNFYLGKDHRT